MSTTSSNEIELPKTSKKKVCAYLMSLFMIDGTAVSKLCWACLPSTLAQNIIHSYLHAFFNTNTVLQIKIIMLKSNSLVNKPCPNTFWQSLCCLISIQRVNKPKSPICYSPQHAFSPFRTFSPLGYVSWGLFYLSFPGELLNRCRSVDIVITNN